MEYPKNFPLEQEKPLTELLLSMEKQFMVKIPQNEKEFNANIRMFWKGRAYPNLWWLNLMLKIHSDQFSYSFIKEIKKYLTKTKIRSQSGVVTLTLFTQGTGCSFDCLYCPKEKDLPKSYFSDEPGIKRAIRNNFDPFKQVKERLTALELSNHPLDKIEILVKGGTFSFYPQNYRENFVKRIFEAVNGKSSLTLLKAQKANEPANRRIIGINIETRPDYINPEEIKFLRFLGVTQVELGVQALDNMILKTINRGHNVEAVKKATFLLKEAGFKVGYHLMLNLPGSSPQKDLLLLKKAFTKDFSPDHLKVYPTVVTKYAKLAELYQNGQYAPYSLPQLIEVLRKFKTEIVPKWVRIGRLTRDITVQMIAGPDMPSNLRETLKVKCNCIRCREIKGQKITGEIKLETTRYLASDGTEYFLEFVDDVHHCLGFLRLRLTKNKKTIVRELHVYGQALTLGQKSQKDVQHQNLGLKLLQNAENIAKNEGFKEISVISGIGARAYYKKFGYKLEDTYMVKGFPL
jgi:elongator complex protein 3